MSNLFGAGCTASRTQEFLSVVGRLMAIGALASVACSALAQTPPQTPCPTTGNLGSVITYYLSGTIASGSLGTAQLSNTSVEFAVTENTGCVHALSPPTSDPPNSFYVNDDPAAVATATFHLTSGIKTALIAAGQLHMSFDIRNHGVAVGSSSGGDVYPFALAGVALTPAAMSATTAPIGGLPFICAGFDPVTNAATSCAPPPIATDLGPLLVDPEDFIGTTTGPCCEPANGFYAAVASPTVFVVPDFANHGTVTSAGTTLACPPACAAPASANQPMLLIAEPAAGYAFVGWNGGCQGSSPSCLVTSGQAATVIQAQFAALPATPVAASTVSNSTFDGPDCAVTSAGNLVCWGNFFGNPFVSSPAVQTAFGNNIVTATSGDNFTCAITQGGSAQCAGAGGFGQLGAGPATTASNIPVTVSGLSAGAVQVSTRWENACAVTSSLEVRCWGDSSFGQIPNWDPANGQAWIPVPVAQLNAMGATAVTVGRSHGCAIVIGGGVWCWGYNAAGQLGNGTNASSLVPVAVAGLPGPATAIVAGEDHTCALTDLGSVWCWGYNVWGQLGAGPGSPVVSLAPSPVIGLGSGVISIAAGDNHTCALSATGNAMCWGQNEAGELGNGLVANYSAATASPVSVIGLPTSAVALSANSNRTCALLKAGGARCWGENNFYQLGASSSLRVSTLPIPIVGLGSHVVQLSAGLQHTCALTSRGAVNCWGDNPNGGLGSNQPGLSAVPVGVAGLNSGAIAVASGHEHSCALTSSGGVSCWGFNGYGQLGGSTPGDSLQPVAVSGLSSGVAAVATGGNHSCAVLATGALQCWGYNQFGQLGTGDTANYPTPQTVNGLSGVVQVSGGDWHTCALLNTGAVQCWGYNNYGQVGAASIGTTPVTKPTAVNLGTNVSAVAITAGSTHTCALTSTGTVLCWGANNYGQLGASSGTGNPATATPIAVDNSQVGSAIAAISSTAYHTCELTFAGAVWCWGYNNEGELGNGASGPGTNSGTPTQVAGLTAGISAISAGGSHSCAITTGGDVQCWGDNVNGQLGNGTTQSTAVPRPLGPLASDNTIAFSYPPGPPASPATVGPGASVTLVATASSGLPVQFSTFTPDHCTVTGNMVQITHGSGLCMVQASQAGDGTFDPAPTVTREIVLQALNPLGVPLGPQAAPVLVSASAAATNLVNLAWTEAAVPGPYPVTGYQVWRADNGGAAAPITNLAATATSYSDTTVSAGNSYVYTVFAVNAAGLSAPSNASTVQLIPQSQPVLVSAAIIATNQVGLTWSEAANAAAPAVSGFQVWRSTNGAAAVLVATIPGAGSLSYADTTVAAGNSYDYTVVALNLIGSSPSSNAIAVPLTALSSDGYTCQTLDVPTSLNSAWTQLWQINDAGQVAALGPQGGSIYDSASGQWIAMSTPPAIGGFVPSDFGSIGIDNHGRIAGFAVDGQNVERGFILSAPPPGGSYLYEPNFASATAPNLINTEFRAISENGLLTGFASAAPYDTPPYLGFVFNPTPAPIANFAPGYTTFVPKLSDGSASMTTIPGGMNAAGYFVGSGASATIRKEAFLYDPNRLAKYSISFGSGVATALRALNDLDPHSKTNCTAANCLRAVGWVGAQPMFVDFDPLSGFQVPQIVDCNAQIAGAVSSLFEGINNRNVIVGDWNDAYGVSHGLIAYPNVTMPTTVAANGSFVFNVTVAANVPAFLDPPVAVGYAYQTGATDPKFASVTLPIGASGNQFTLLVQGRSFPVTAGRRFDFTANGFARGVTSFTVEGIAPAAALSPSNTTAFVTEVTFLSGGKFTGSMTPIQAAGEIALLRRAADSAPAPLESDAENIARKYSASNIAGACTGLAKFITDVGALTPAKLSAVSAAYLSAQALAIKSAIACP